MRGYGHKHEVTNRGGTKIDFRETKHWFMLHTTLQEWLDNKDFIQGRMQLADQLINEQYATL